MKFKIYIISILLAVVTSTTIFAQIPTVERDALIALYNATDGSNWINNTNWNTTEPVSTWFGVTLLEGNQIALDLSANQLVGNIPTDIGIVNSLYSLNLSNNQLSGSIPVELGNLSFLTEIFLNNNQLTGSIPSEIGDIPFLFTLVLHSNQLTGNLPTLNASTTQTIQINDNNFIFSGIETEFANYQQLSSNTFVYAPQSKTDSEETIDVTGGASYTMTIGLTSLNNSYQWFKDGTAITGATQKDYTISNASVTDAGDYHCIAVNNIVTGLTLERFPIHITVSSGGVPQLERDALIALYNATNGANWTNNTNWNTTAPVDTWNRVTVTNGHVTAITLQANNLVGSIPPEIGNLTELTILVLYTNQLTGVIPPEIGNLTKLVSLNLPSNQLTGFIPPELGNLTSLTDLTLDNNQLAGSIPPEIGNLTNLTSLRLGNNTLTGNIPSELGNLINLSIFIIRNNEISGIIPAELINLNNLTHLYLNNNQLSGNLPPISSPKSYIYISDNNFHFSNLENEFTAYQTNTTILFEYSPQRKFDNIETINIILGNTYTLSTSLTSLNNNYQWYKDGEAIVDATQKDYIITNALTTDVGDYHCEVTNSTVTGLTLERNPIHIINDGAACAIPQIEKDALLAFYNATSGDFWTNKTNWNSTEPVCDWFGVTVANGHVTELNLFKNNLNGIIPIEIGNLTNLTSLELMWNNLSGVIPLELGDLTGLTNLKLAINKLTGGIPSELGNLISLTELRLDSNKFGGTIPTELSNLINLTSLNLGHCQLTGSIPLELGNLLNLVELRLNGNQLSGIIPLELGNLSSLELLFLEFNHFSGSIPAELGNLLNLSVLDIHGNTFITGTIPPELGNLSNLTILALSSMKLTGTIPSELGNLTNLTRLSLFFNDLSGSIPVELGNLSSLTSLGLSNNNLSGTIPSELGNLINLQTLSLRENLLSGSIPVELGNLNNLHSLDFSTNRLTGDLPVLSLTSIIGISIDNNNFQFSNIETQFTNYQSGLNYFSYSPQNKVDTEETINIAAGGSHTMSTSLTSTNNSYQWFKDGVAIASATQKEYTISNATTTDVGNYHCTATNSIVTGLTLERFLIHITVGGNTGGVSQIERDALIALYNATNGPNWTNNTNWNTTESVDTWYGVTVVDSKVTQVLLVNNNLVGTIPPEIGNLTNVSILGLISNSQLTGSIPLEIGNLQSVTQLAFSSNALTGSIPTSISNLQNLIRLDLDKNQLTGGIISELGSIPLLATLNLNDNQFTGSIPLELTVLNNLTRLALHNNQLSGAIPTLTSLQQAFDIRNNKYHFSDFEADFNNYENNITFFNYSPQAKIDLEETVDLLVGDSYTLSVSLTSPNNSYQWFKNGNAIAGATQNDYTISNAVTTDIGDYYCRVTNSIITGLTLERFPIHITINGSSCLLESKREALIALYNATDGPNWTNNTNWLTDVPVCEWYGVNYFTENFIYLSLGSNNLTGTIPPEVGSLIEFTGLILSDNNLSGSIPSEIGNMMNLRSLYLWGNQLTGSIPPELGNLINLSTLYLYNNQLTGAIPPELGNLVNTSSFNLSNNQLTGSIPTELGNLASLGTLVLSQNQLTGTIPLELGSLSNLSTLWLGSNSITGSIPAWLGNLTKLYNLNLSNNQFTGAIPTELGNLDLRWLYLSNNKLSGSLPSLSSTVNTITLNNNDFVFNNLEVEFSSYQSIVSTNNGVFRYSPQNKFDIEETINIVGGGTTTLTTSLTSPNNSYQWYRDGVEIVGATVKDYTISNASVADIGDYYVTVTNSIVTGLTLERFPIHIIIDGSSCNITQEEKDILIALYNATDGPNWTNNTNWLSDLPVCEWDRLGSFGSNRFLELNSNNLSGIIPSELGNLTNLRLLNLSNNNFSGSSIPSVLGNLTNLTGLFLNESQLLGEIPSELGLLINLTRFNLNSNELTGTIPPQLGNLINLTNIDLHANKLTGNVPPELANLADGIVLLLYDNLLTGSIPTEFNNLTGSIVVLFQNQLTGPIPDLTSATVSLIYENNFKFIDFETEFVNNITNGNFNYIPQNKIDIEETIDINVGDNYTMTISLTSFNNSYQWFKDSIAIPGATLKNYNINNSTLADAGDYYVTSTNSIVTDLTLSRFPIHLNVNEILPCDTIVKLIGTDRLINCIASPISFSINTLPSGIIDKSYVWTFYDLDNTTVLGTSTLENSEFTYNTIGSYLVTLEITHSTGCIFTSDNTITIEDCIVSPEPVDCDTCDSFKPMPGKKYVISGWVKENREILCSPGIINSLTPTTDGRLEVNFTLEGITSYINIQQSFDQINWTNNTGATVSPRIIPPLGNGLIYVRFTTDYCEEFSEVVTIDYQQPIAIITGPSIAYINNPAKFNLSVTGSNSPITNWSVDFGDGNVQNGVGPPPIILSHEYTIESVGKKVVVFNITNEAGFSAQGITLVKVIDGIPLGFDLFTGEITGEPRSVVYIRTIVTGMDRDRVSVRVINSLDGALVYSRISLLGIETYQFIIPDSGIAILTASLINFDDTSRATIKLSDTVSNLDTTRFQFTLDTINSEFPFFQ